MSTDLNLDLDALPSLDDHPWCEWEGAKSIHGEGEAATGISHLPCSACGFVQRSLIGDACIAMMHRVHREIPDLTFDCQSCESAQPFLRVSITPI